MSINSSSSDSKGVVVKNESNIGFKQPKMRGKCKVYTPFVSFRTKNDAEVALKREFEGVRWHYHERKNQVKDTKIYYKCAPGCSKRLYIRLFDERDGATIYISEDEHNHGSSRYGLSEETMRKVKELIDLDFANRDILREIRSLGIEQITDQQLKNFKARYSTSKHSKAKVDLIELRKWSDSRAEKIPIGLKRKNGYNKMFN